METAFAGNAGQGKEQAPGAAGHDQEKEEPQPVTIKRQAHVAVTVRSTLRSRTIAMPASMVTRATQNQSP